MICLLPLCYLRRWQSDKRHIIYVIAPVLPCMQPCSAYWCASAPPPPRHFLGDACMPSGAAWTALQGSAPPPRGRAHRPPSCAGQRSGGPAPTASRQRCARTDRRLPRAAWTASASTRTASSSRDAPVCARVGRVAESPESRVAQNADSRRLAGRSK